MYVPRRGARSIHLDNLVPKSHHNETASSHQLAENDQNQSIGLLDSFPLFASESKPPPPKNASEKITWGGAARLFFLHRFVYYATPETPFNIVLPSLLQSSQMVSKSRSLRRSAPQTLQRFRFMSLDPYPSVRPRGGASIAARPFPSACSPSPASAASAASATATALSWASLSASRAASSASGVSGIVSKLEMLGLRDRADVGVDGTEDKLPP